MVNKRLTDFTTQKNAIVTAIGHKISRGFYDQSLHNSFKPSKINIYDIETIFNSIESKLRKIEIIYYTYFDSEYDSNIIVNNTLIVNKIIETEFNYSTKVLKSRIDVNDPSLYKELIDSNFCTLILNVASLYEVLVKLSETLLKKIVLYDGERTPYKSITLKLFILNWDKLIELRYRKNDGFYNCFNSHRIYIDKYLDQINVIRNRIIHGYLNNLEINTTHSKYMVTNHDTSNFPLVAGGGIDSNLIVNNFVNDVLLNTTSLITDLLNLFVTKLTHHRSKLPM
jgi:hypothetical protein